MNCAESREQLVLHIEQLLDESQERGLAEHLAGCRSCRAELKELEILQQRLVHSGRAAAGGSLEEPVMNRIIREQNARLKIAAQATASLRLRRWIMKSPMTRIAAAAVVAVTCVLAFSMWRQTGSIALADVIARLERVQAYFYRETTTVKDPVRGDRRSEGTVLVSDPYGMKSDRTSVNDADGTRTQLLTYLLPQDKSVVFIHPAEKQFARRALDDATTADLKLESHDPREMIKRLLTCRHQDLGTTVIEGVTAQGFETTDPAYLGNTVSKLSARLWVDVQTTLPVRYELDTEIHEGVRLSTVQDGYEWDIQVDRTEFTPEIPADYTAEENDGMQMPSYSEAGFIEALRIAAEFAGRYPDTLDRESWQALVKEISETAMTAETPAARQWREQLKAAGSREAAIQIGEQRMMKLTSLRVFPTVLATQGAEPVYHGKVVTPQDLELPLMRWNLADGQYRVIFGDLHAETVAAEVLADLEAALPQ